MTAAARVGVLEKVEAAVTQRSPRGVVAGGDNGEAVGKGIPARVSAMCAARGFPAADAGACPAEAARKPGGEDDGDDALRCDQRDVDAGSLGRAAR